MNRHLLSALLVISLVSRTGLGFSTGLRIPSGWESFASFERLVLEEELPDAWDWRDHGFTAPVKDQGSCGSCWAFGSTASFEAALQIKGVPYVPLSEQELVSCVKEYYGCGGGYLAHDYQVSPGQATAQDFPYRAANVACKKNLKHDAKAVSWKYVGEQGRKPTTLELKTAIKQYGVLTVVVYANNAMASYKSGVFKGCANRQSNHMVNLVGWTKAGNFIMRNSWGPKWGNQGHMEIPPGCSNIGEIAAFVVVQ